MRELSPDHTKRPAASSGTDMPRGGRAASEKRLPAERSTDNREALTRQLALPRTQERTQVVARGHEYQLRASEVRLLATIGAFRVVNVRDLSTDTDRWRGDLQHLRREGLVAIRAAHGDRGAVATLTADARALLDQHRRADVGDARQAYYAGVVKPREITHDAQLYRAYVDAATRLDAAGGRVTRVVLDFELKRDYQRFLQEPNRGDRQASGRPKRSPEDIEAWATAHHLRVVDGHVQFPDVRVEYEQPDGREGREDLELATEHYSSRQMAAKCAAGFTMHGGGSRRGGAPFDPHAAEQVLR